jgi:peptidyl-prolyl cis-trans isomerase SurA
MSTRLMSAGLAVILLLAALAGSVPLRAEILEQVLVKVNGDILTKTEFEARQVAVLRSRPELANGSPSNAELQRVVAEITPDVVLEAVDELLLVQRGREMNYSLSDEQFTRIVDDIKKSNKITDDAQFQAALKQEGLTLEDFRQRVERQMLSDQVQRVDVLAKISVNDEEARAYFETHAQEFRTPSEITLREILIEVPTTEKGVNVAQDDEARARAEEVRKRLVGGEPFPRLAAEYSGSPSKANGGLIGPIRSDELAPQLQKLLDALKVGELTEVIRTTRGYQILKLESRTETKVKTFDEARGEIADRVVNTKRRAELEKYLDRLREQATISWRNAELQKAYNLALTRRRNAAAATGQQG